MQYVIAARTAGRTRYIRDMRSMRPTYSAFDLTSRDVCTVAPNLAFAKEVKAAFREYCIKFGASGLGYEPPAELVLVKVTP